MWWRRKTDLEKTVSRLWGEHMRSEFPARLRSEEFAGVDMVMLDADLAGCIVTWLNNRGFLDERRQELLRQLLADLDRVLPLLDDEQERAYYVRLRELAQLVSGSAQ